MKREPSAEARELAARWIRVHIDPPTEWEAIELSLAKLLEEFKESSHE